MQSPLNPRYALSRIDLQGDSLQKSFSSIPTLVSPFDSAGFMQDFLSGTDTSSPTTTTTQGSGDPGVLDQINKKLGELIGLQNGLVTGANPLDNLFRDTVVAGVGLLFLGVGLYALTK